MGFAILEVKIVDVDPDEVLKFCWVCKRSTALCPQISGPLAGWIQCQACKCWYHPDVRFEGENDDSVIID